MEKVTIDFERLCLALKIVKEDGVEALEMEYGDTCDDWWGGNE